MRELSNSKSTTSDVMQKITEKWKQMWIHAATSLKTFTNFEWGGTNFVWTSPTRLHDNES